MIFTDNNIVGSAIAFGVGILVAYINYAISKFILKKHPDMYASSQIIRQIIQIGYLVLLYCFGTYTPWDPIWLLAGGCLGITLPMFYFTFRLVKLNEKNSKKEDEKDGS